ncbi:LPS translocon maturation chaperone LptM [Paenalcaligenes hominis]
MNYVLTRLSALSLLIALFVGAAGCGYKGPLYLPESPSKPDSVSQN